MCACPPAAQVHEAIRADPAPKPKERDAPSEKKKWKATKLTYEERKAALKVPPLRSRPEACSPPLVSCDAACCCSVSCILLVSGSCHQAAPSEGGQGQGSKSA